MVRQNKKNLDIQKKSYHTDKFYCPIQTHKFPIVGSPYEVISNHLCYKHQILNSYIELGTAVFWIEKSDIVSFLTQLKSLGYEVLSEMSAIDLLALQGNFEMFYQVLSVKKNDADKRRIRIKCYVEPQEKIDSITNIYRCAIWSEREVFDMFGIVFEKHPLLQRLLMPEDWVGHPLLKSYPLKGDESASWYEVDKIFGKEYRDIIGPEQRDSARVDEKDTFNFARLGYPTQKGIKIPSDLPFNKSDKTLFIKNLDPAKSKILKKRL